MPNRSTLWAGRRDGVRIPYALMSTGMLTMLIRPAARVHLTWLP